MKIHASIVVLTATVVAWAWTGANAEPKDTDKASAAPATRPARRISPIALDLKKRTVSLVGAALALVKRHSWLQATRQADRPTRGSMFVGNVSVSMASATESLSAADTIWSVPSPDMRVSVLGGSTVLPCARENRSLDF